MNKDAQNIRCRNDLQLAEVLLQNPAVKQVNESLERQAGEGPMGIRRRLLATSVRLSERMVPEVHRMAAECVERLGVEIPVELFVYSSPQFNAACFKPENERLYVMFSSSLLEAFPGAELRFVMGHELGHHLYSHHDIPIGYLLRGRPPPGPRLALQLFAWSRYAEISADRAGAHCAQDLEAVSRSLFRLASGLSGDIVTFNLEDFLQQVDDMQVVDSEPGQGAPREDWFSTHPFSPLRVKALQLFHQSVLAADSGLSVEELEVGVQDLMGLMEPSYLEGRTPEAESMRRLLFAGAIAVAQADGEISDEEIEIFEDFFGAGSFSPKLDVPQLVAELPGRIEHTREHTGPSQHLQVVRDLCLLARSEAHRAEPELAVIYEIAKGLGVRRDFVDQFMDASVEPD